MIILSMEMSSCVIPLGTLGVFLLSNSSGSAISLTEVSSSLRNFSSHLTSVRINLCYNGFTWPFVFLYVEVSVSAYVKD